MNKKNNKEISNTELLDSINRSFSKMEEKIGTRLDTVEESIKATRRDILNIGDTYVSYRKFDELASRVTKLEKSKK